MTMVWDLPCRLQDLNLQPPYYKYGALPIAPSRRDRQSIDARGVVRSGQPAGVAVGVGVGVADGVGVAVGVAVDVGVAVGVGVSVGVGAGVTTGPGPVHGVPSSAKAVGAGLLPLYEPLKPRSTVPPVARRPL